MSSLFYLLVRNVIIRKKYKNGTYKVEMELCVGYMTRGSLFNGKSINGPGKDLFLFVGSTRGNPNSFESREFMYYFNFVFSKNFDNVTKGASVLHNNLCVKNSLSSTGEYVEDDVDAIYFRKESFQDSIYVQLFEEDVLGYLQFIRKRAYVTEYRAVKFGRQLPMENQARVYQDKLQILMKQWMLSSLWMQLRKVFQLNRSVLRVGFFYLFKFFFFINKYYRDLFDKNNTYYNFIFIKRLLLTQLYQNSYVSFGQYSVRLLDVNQVKVNLFSVNYDYLHFFENVTYFRRSDYGYLIPSLKKSFQFFKYFKFLNKRRVFKNTSAPKRFLKYRKRIAYSNIQKSFFKKGKYRRLFFNTFLHYFIRKTTLYKLVPNALIYKRMDRREFFMYYIFKKLPFYVTNLRKKNKNKKLRLSSRKFKRKLKSILRVYIKKLGKRALKLYNIRKGRYISNSFFFTSSLYSLYRFKFLFKFSEYIEAGNLIKDRNFIFKKHHKMYDDTPLSVFHPKSRFFYKKRKRRRRKFIKNFKRYLKVERQNFFRKTMLDLSLKDKEQKVREEKREDELTPMQRRRMVLTGKYDTDYYSLSNFFFEKKKRKRSWFLKWKRSYMSFLGKRDLRTSLLTKEYMLWFKQAGLLQFFFKERISSKFLKKKMQSNLYLISQFFKIFLRNRLGLLKIYRKNFKEHKKKGLIYIQNNFLRFSLFKEKFFLRIRYILLSIYLKGLSTKYKNIMNFMFNFHRFSIYKNSIDVSKDLRLIRLLYFYIFGEKISSTPGTVRGFISYWLPLNFEKDIYPADNAIFYNSMDQKLNLIPRLKERKKKKSKNEEEEKKKIKKIRIYNKKSKKSKKSKKKKLFFLNLGYGIKNLKASFTINRMFKFFDNFNFSGQAFVSFIKKRLFSFFFFKLIMQYLIFYNSIVMHLKACQVRSQVLYKRHYTYSPRLSKIESYVRINYTKRKPKEVMLSSGVFDDKPKPIVKKSKVAVRRESLKNDLGKTLVPLKLYKRGVRYYRRKRKIAKEIMYGNLLPVRTFKKYIKDMYLRRMERYEPYFFDYRYEDSYYIYRAFFKEKKDLKKRKEEAKLAKYHERQQRKLDKLYNLTEREIREAYEFADKWLPILPPKLPRKLLYATKTTLKNVERLKRKSILFPNFWYNFRLRRYLKTDYLYGSGRALGLLSKTAHASIRLLLPQYVKKIYLKYLYFKYMNSVDISPQRFGRYLKNRNLKPKWDPIFRPKQVGKRLLMNQAAYIPSTFIMRWLFKTHRYLLGHGTFIFKQLSSLDKNLAFLKKSITKLEMISFFKYIRNKDKYLLNLRYNFWNRKFLKDFSSFKNENNNNNNNNLFKKIKKKEIKSNYFFFKFYFLLTFIFSYFFSFKKVFLKRFFFFFKCFYTFNKFYGNLQKLSKKRYIRRYTNYFNLLFIKKKFRFFYLKRFYKKQIKRYGILRGRALLLKKLKRIRKLRVFSYSSRELVINNDFMKGKNFNRFFLNKKIEKKSFFFYKKLFQSIFFYFIRYVGLSTNSLRLGQKYEQNLYVFFRFFSFKFLKKKHSIIFSIILKFLFNSSKEQRNVFFRKILKKKSNNYFFIRKFFSIKSNLLERKLIFINKRMDRNLFKMQHLKKNINIFLGKRLRDKFNSMKPIMQLEGSRIRLPFSKKEQDAFSVLKINFLKKPLMKNIFYQFYKNFKFLFKLFNEDSSFITMWFPIRQRNKKIKGLSFYKLPFVKYFLEFFSVGLGWLNVNSERNVLLFKYFNILKEGDNFLSKLFHLQKHDKFFKKENFYKGFVFFKRGLLHPDSAYFLGKSKQSLVSFTDSFVSTFNLQIIRFNMKRFKNDMLLFLNKFILFFFNSNKISIFFKNISNIRLSQRKKSINYNIFYKLNAINKLYSFKDIEILSLYYQGESRPAVVKAIKTAFNIRLDKYFEKKQEIMNKENNYLFKNADLRKLLIKTKAEMDISMLRKSSSFLDPFFFLKHYYYFTILINSFLYKRRRIKLYFYRRVGLRIRSRLSTYRKYINYRARVVGSKRNKYNKIRRLISKRRGFFKRFFKNKRFQYRLSKASLRRKNTFYKAKALEKLLLYQQFNTIF